VPLRLPGREAEADLEAERRLLYVGLTRARRRSLSGQTGDRAPCPFPRGVPPPLLEDAVPAARAPRGRQLSLGF
jgi:superfamily I DNA/RNA helicase